MLWEGKRERFGGYCCSDVRSYSSQQQILLGSPYGEGAGASTELLLCRPLNPGRTELGAAIPRHWSLVFEVCEPRGARMCMGQQSRRLGRGQIKAGWPVDAMRATV